MKKKIVFLLIAVVLLSGCSFGKKAIDKPAEDGSYLYTNKDLGFSLTLPKEFQYYQTQRLEKEGYKDLEIFVPTSDRAYPQEVPSYAKPIVIRIYEKAAWQEAANSEEVKDNYQILRETDNSVYLVRWWDKIPVDWSQKWSEEMKKQIIARFSLM